MSNEYTPFSERTVAGPTKGPWGRPSDLVHYARKKGWLDELEVSFLDKELIVQANDMHSKSLEEWEQKGEWKDEDTERNVIDMLKPFGELETKELKEAGKRRMHNTEKNKDKNAPQSIEQKDLITDRRMPKDLREQLDKNKPKVEPTEKDKLRRRRGKEQQKQKQKLQDYTRQDY